MSHHRNGWPGRRAALVLGAGALAAATLAAAPAAAGTSLIVCGRVSGDHYNFLAPGSQHRLSGDRYLVHATAGSC